MPPSTPPKSKSTEDRYQPGYTLDNTYVLKELLGQGGMGSVFRAEHLLMRQDYAVKILAAEKISEDNWQRFSLEARAIAKMDHPSIVKIHNMGIDSHHVPYYVMDLLKGITLADLCKPGTHTGLDKLIEIFKQIAQGLSYAHKKGFVHRDIKPSNIVLITDGTKAKVRIVDFGIAKLTNSGLLSSQVQTKTGEIFGSPFYMSPEQCLGEPCDERSDIYSLGCSLFEVLTKTTPFRGKTAVETMMMHQSEPPPELSQFMSPQDPLQDFQPLLYKMLEKSPSRRYQSMDALLHDLERLEQGKAIGNTLMPKRSALSAPKSDEDAAEKPVFGKLSIVAGGLIAVVSLSIAGGVFYIGAQNQKHQEELVSEAASHPTPTVTMADIDTHLSDKIDKPSPAKPDDLSALGTAEKEVFNPDDRAKVRALEKAGPIKSWIVTEHGRTFKKIDFPQEMIGFYYYETRDGMHEIHHAKHYREIEADADLTLQISPDEGVCAFFHPAVYKKIAPTEFNELYLIGKPEEGFSSVPKVYLNKYLPCCMEILQTASLWTALSRLKLRDVALDKAKNLDVFNRFHSVKSLTLEHISNLPYQKLAKTKIFDRLETLNLRDCGNVDALIEAVANKEKLNSIGLQGPDISAHTLTLIKNHKHLKTLELLGRPLAEPEIKALAELKDLSTLRYFKANLDKEQIATLLSQSKTRILLLPKRRYRDDDKIMKAFEHNQQVVFDDDLAD